MRAIQLLSLIGVLTCLQDVLGGDHFAYPRLGDTELLQARENKILGLINTVKEKQLSLRGRLDALESDGLLSSTYTKKTHNRDYLTKKQLNYFLRKINPATVKSVDKKGLFDDIGGAFNDAVDWVGDVGNAIGGGVEDAAGAVGGAVTNVWDEFTDWAAGPIGGIVDYADDIAYFFNNIAGRLESFISNMAARVETCFRDFEACVKNIYEDVVRPVLEALRDQWLSVLNNGPGIGGPVAVWQGMAHQLRLADTGKCLGYRPNGGSYIVEVRDCLDPKSATSQDFKLTPCDNCHDTAFSFFDIFEFLMRVCNVGDTTTRRSWSMMIEISSFGHVVSRGRTTAIGDRVQLELTAVCLVYPLSLFTRVIDLKADVQLINGDINFSITSLSTSPSSGFVDFILRPLRTSFTIPVGVIGLSVNPGGFQNFVSSIAPTSLCTNGCRYRNDGDCDDGGPNSDYNYCALGDDCDDCGARQSAGKK